MSATVVSGGRDPGDASRVMRILSHSCKLLAMRSDSENVSDKNKRMKRRFLSFSSSTEPEEIQKGFDDYAKYLASVADRFPANALAFARAEWHYQTSDPRCPHDAWLETLEVAEKSLQPGGSQRIITITATFLGAYHDGTFTLSYSNVSHYRFDKPSNASHKFLSGLKGHSDWLIDEMSLTDDGHVLHEIDFGSLATWSVCCEDVSYSWNAYRKQVG